MSKIQKTYYLKTVEHVLLNLSIYRKENLKKTRCKIYRGGNIDCIFSRVRHTARCDADFTFWPYHTQNCTLTLSLWPYTNQQVNFLRAHVLPYPVIEHGSKEWDTVSNYSQEQNETYKFDRKYNTSSFEIHMVFRSNGNILRAAFVVPAFGNELINSKFRNF